MVFWNSRTWTLSQFSFWGGGYSWVNFGHPKSEVFRNGGGVFQSKLWSSQIWSFLKWGGGYSGLNFGHLKSEVFQNGGGAFWSEIPERGYLENLGKNLLFSQKPACASQTVSHILRMWRLTNIKSCDVILKFKTSLGILWLLLKLCFRKYCFDTRGRQTFHLHNRTCKSECPPSPNLNAKLQKILYRSR